MTQALATAPSTGVPSAYTSRKAAAIIGVLFIFATVSAILALPLYSPLLSSTDYLVTGAQHATQVVLGAMMELILVITAIGTAVGLFPILRRYDDRIALAHLSFRFLEAVIITVGIVSVLALLTLSQTFVATPNPDASAFNAAGEVLLATHKWTFMLGPGLFLGVNTLMYSFLLYRSQSVPRPLATLGMVGGALNILGGLLGLLGVAPAFSPVSGVLSLPVAMYEMILAGWLISRGFSTSAATSQPARTATNQLLNAA